MIEQELEKTGIYTDHLNEFMGLKMVYDGKRREDIPRLIKDNPIPYYEDKYGKDSVNDNNRERVKELNNLADRINEFLLNPEFEDETFKDLVNQGFILIKGDENSLVYNI